MALLITNIQNSVQYCIALQKKKDIYKQAKGLIKKSINIFYCLRGVVAVMNFYLEISIIKVTKRVTLQIILGV